MKKEGEMTKEVANKVQYYEIDELKTLDRNPRTITKKQLEKLKTSIKDNPDYFEARPLILSNRTGSLVIIAGNQRWRAAKALGLEQVPCVLIEGLDEEREREIVIRDNVNNGAWDFDMLANEWDEIKLGEWGVETSWKPLQEKVEEPDLEFTEVLGEENNYIVLKFNNKVDWLSAQTFFKLDRKKDFYTAEGGGLKQEGLGRVIDGAEALRALGAIE